MMSFDKPLTLPEALEIEKKFCGAGTLFRDKLNELKKIDSIAEASAALSSRTYVLRWNLWLGECDRTERVYFPTPTCKPKSAPKIRLQSMLFVSAWPEKKILTLPMPNVRSYRPEDECYRAVVTISDFLVAKYNEIILANSSARSFNQCE